MPSATVPPPREPPLMGLSNWFTHTWWRYLSRVDAVSSDATVIANEALSVANAADTVATNAQVLATAAGAAAAVAEATALDALDTATQALLRVEPIVFDGDQIVLLSLMISGKYP